MQNRTKGQDKGFLNLRSAGELRRRETEPKLEDEFSFISMNFSFIILFKLFQDLTAPKGWNTPGFQLTETWWFCTLDWPLKNSIIIQICKKLGQEKSS